jgi:hypothetical protein
VEPIDLGELVQHGKFLQQHLGGVATVRERPVVPYTSELQRIVKHPF